MQSAFNAAFLLMGLVAAPTAAAILSSGGLSSPSTLKATEAVPLHETRTIAGTPVDARDGEAAPFDFTAAIDWPPAPPGLPGPRPGAGNPIQSDASVPPSFGARFRPEIASPLPPPLPSTRRGCEEGIDRLMGAAGYLKSKIRLQGEQNSLWQRLELAATPPAEKLRELRSALPSRPAPPPNLLERIDFAEKQAAIRLELFRAIHDPLHALYESLSADQRALLAIGPRPWMPPPQQPRPIP